MAQDFATRVAEAKSAVKSVTAEEAARLKGQPRTFFVDPRPADAILATTGIIRGAKNIELADIASGNLPGPLTDKSVTIVTACQAGPMGAVAAHEFARLGFTDVAYVDGGTQAWVDAGYEVRR